MTKSCSDVIMTRHRLLWMARIAPSMHVMLSIMTLAPVSATHLLYSYLYRKIKCESSRTTDIIQVSPRRRLPNPRRAYVKSLGSL